MSIGQMISKSGQFLQVERSTRVVDTMGGETRTWQTIAQLIPCWKQPARTKMIEEYFARNLVITHQVFVEKDLELLEGDRLCIDDDKYIVRGFIDQAGIGFLWCVIVEERVG